MAIDPNDWNQQIQQQSSPSENPLSKHFRTPAIQLKLPSGGKYWLPNSIELTSINEYPVYPMTARDEMVFNNPDALMNGQAVVDVIQSCIPAIKNAWGMPSIDVDSVLIAIRIASYGEEMDFNSTCPNCNEENTFSMDLKHFIDRNVDIGVFDNQYPNENLIFKFKPQKYEVINQLNMENFETQRLLHVIENADLPDDEKIKRVNDIFAKMTQRTVTVIGNAIESITTNDGQVVDNTAYIDDFLKNCSRKVFAFIQEEIDKIAKHVGLQDTDITCAECNYEYTVPFTFDNANFFG